MKRSAAVCAAIFGAALTLALLLAWLAGSSARYERQLESVYDSTEIRCTISDLKGQTDGIIIHNPYIEMFTKSFYEFYPLAKNPYFKTAMRYEPVFDLPEESGEKTAESAGELVGVNVFQADHRLLPENGAAIAYAEGYSERSFASEEYIVWVHESWLKKYELAYGDILRLEAVIPDEHGYRATESFAIAGSFSGGESGTLYIPWAAAMTLIEQTGSQRPWVNSLSFAVADNRELALFTETSARFFGVVDVLGVTSQGKLMWALTVHDEQFMAALLSAQKSIRMLRLLTPLFYGLSFAIGFLASYIFTRNRRREFYLLRCIGVKPAGILTAVMFEQLLLALAGALAGMMLAFALWREDARASAPALTLLIFFSGAAMSALITVRGGIKNIQEE